MRFVIAGKINCRQYSFAVMVAQRLKENLPEFDYMKIPQRPENWEKWLIKMCKENCWYHIKSPIIWKEVSQRRGKKFLIGDIDKFLDLCYDYYGIPREALSAENFNRGEMDWFANRTETEFFEDVKADANKRREYRSRQICITGASCQMCDVLIMELLQLRSQKRENGLEIRLFDEPSNEKKLEGSASDAKCCPGPSGLGNCRVVTTLKDALTNVDLVIVLDCFGRKPKESLVKWLKRNRNAMCALGKGLNKYAPTHCRVIIGSPSDQPNCYNATVLASFATRLHVRNIVVVTQDLGREISRSLAKKVGVPLKDFFCPPVWGFVGLNKFVDATRTLQTHVYRVPGKRLNSTLPQGREELVLRTTETSLSEDQTQNLQEDLPDAESYPLLRRWPCLAKATAILDLLRLWGLKQEDGDGEILCLGVYSDGTFNIPQGIYWSQPVILKKGFWVPFADFPIPRSSSVNMHCLFLYSIAALYRTKVKPRIYVAPKAVAKAGEATRFDFEKIAEEVGMPTIRTDEECAKYLKYLAKKELGIDLDAVESESEEESEPQTPLEEVRREQIFCECWRRELKQLQKVVFDHPSTTEVEMDLSDNISGSEWSIINPKEAATSEGTVKRGGPSYRRHASGSIADSETGESLRGENKETSSSTTVCSCGALQDGSACQCLGLPKAASPSVAGEENASTEHFYKEQNAQVFEVDAKDVIYADEYPEVKQVSFDADAKDAEGAKLKFYGRKDAIRDEKADAAMRKRILRYERGGEGSFGEEEEEEEEEEKSLEGTASASRTDVKGEKVAKEGKFHISIQGTSYEILGDQDGLEQLDAARKADKSEASFREMYADEITPTLQVLPPAGGTSTESESEKEASIFGEGTYRYPPVIPEVYGETSMASLERELDRVWDEGMYDDEERSEGDDEREDKEEGKEEDKQPKEPRWKRKIEGVPRCCLCRCIVPEGLPCCPCGTSTVVEVFKKESVEVFVHSEDDISFRIEYFETALPPEASTYPIPKRSGTSVTEADGLEDDLHKGRDLPPESFFPFSPKPENKFRMPTRPQEMTKEYLESLKKPEGGIPERCKELLDLAKAQLEEENLSSEGEEEDQKAAAEPKEEDEGAIKTDFSNLMMFIPEGIEDWRVTVQRKYREWFFQGPRTQDESYYDVAIEEVSEDEFEIDKEMEVYFEK